MFLFNIKKLKIENQELKNKIIELDQAIVRLERKNKEKSKEVDNYINLCNSLNEDNSKKENKIIELSKKIHSLQGAKGGLKSENNKLKEIVKDLTLKLEESMTDKYLVRKIPSGRMPKAPVRKIKSHSKQSNIIKNIYKD